MPAIVPGLSSRPGGHASGPASHLSPAQSRAPRFERSQAEGAGAGRRGDPAFPDRTGGDVSLRGRAKVFILREAERMNDAAQNSLLKTLEEPPRSTFLILLTSALDRLLPTTRSRSQQVIFSPLPEAFVLEELGRLRPQAAAKRAAIRGAAVCGESGRRLAAARRRLVRAQAALGRAAHRIVARRQGLCAPRPGQAILGGCQIAGQAGRGAGSGDFRHGCDPGWSADAAGQPSAIFTPTRCGKRRGRRSPRSMRISRK